MYLSTIADDNSGEGPHKAAFGAIRAMGLPAPEILHLLAYKPQVTKHLDRFSQEVMRGPSPLSPGLRELIAAFTAARNHCPF